MRSGVGRAYDLMQCSSVMGRAHDLIQCNSDVGKADMMHGSGWGGVYKLM